MYDYGFVVLEDLEVLENMVFLYLHNIQDDKCCLWEGGLLLWLYTVRTCQKTRS